MMQSELELPATLCRPDCFGRSTTIHVSMQQTPIGNGRFGHVYSCTYRTSQSATQQPAVVKKVWLTDAQMRDEQLPEVAALLHLQRQAVHDNVIVLEAYYDVQLGNRRCVQLIMQPMKFNLAEVLREYAIQVVVEYSLPAASVCSSALQQRPPAQSRATSWALQLWRAMQHLDKYNVCHRDIKPANILLCEAQTQLKLADFGEAVVVTGRDSLPLSAYVVTRYYRAPELLLGASDYNQRVDWFAAALVMCEMYTAKVVDDNLMFHWLTRLSAMRVPASTQLLVRQQRQTPAKQWPTLLQPHPAIPTALVPVLAGVLVYDPTKRMSPTQVLQHDYFHRNASHSSRSSSERD